MFVIGVCIVATGLWTPAWLFSFHHLSEIAPDIHTHTHRLGSLSPLFTWVVGLHFRRAIKQSVNSDLPSPGMKVLRNRQMTASGKGMVGMAALRGPFFSLTSTTTPPPPPIGTPDMALAPRLSPTTRPCSAAPSFWAISLYVSSHRVCFVSLCGVNSWPATDATEPNVDVEKVAEISGMSENNLWRINLKSLQTQWNPVDKFSSFTASVLRRVWSSCGEIVSFF